MNPTTISWASHTHNFWIGCKKVSEGCKFCYMFRMSENNEYDPSKVKRLSDKYFCMPISMKVPQLIFVNSMSDFFIEEADQWRPDAWDVIRKSPQHTWLVLTKRPERILEQLPPDWVENFQHVWLGVSIESQAYTSRMEILADIPHPKKFISAEPLLEPLNLTYTKPDGTRPIDGFRWCIIGGESGNETGPYRYRECKLEWIEGLVKDLQENAPQVGIHMKQLGSWLKKTMNLKGYHGSDPNEFPPHLRLRKRPKVKTFAEAYPSDATKNSDFLTKKDNTNGKN